MRVLHALLNVYRSNTAHLYIFHVETVTLFQLLLCINCACICVLVQLTRKRSNPVHLHV